MTQGELLEKIALYEHACGVSKEIHALKSFAAYYRARLSKSDVRLLNRYAKVKAKCAKDLAAMFEEERVT